MELRGKVIDLHKLYFLMMQQHERSLKLIPYFAKAVFIVLIAYLLSSTITAFFVPLLSTSAMPPTKAAAIPAASMRVAASKPINHRDLRKIVKDRNIFNSEGAFPDEPNIEVGAAGGAVFNQNAPCSKTSLNIELLGIIYQRGGQSLATIQEKGVGYADIYQVGDTIVGSERAVIFDITQWEVIINNAGTKECLELENVDKAVQAKFQTPGAADAGLAGLSSSKPADQGASSGEYQHYTLTPDYVEKALGPGFGKILEAGRLVPHNKDGQMIGFKLINVEADSLFRKIGLGNGDVITKVNDISMAQPDQGFAFYQALQDSREIRVEYLKGGNQPSVLTVEIK
jgi:general secretion pathway protein C